MNKILFLLSNTWFDGSGYKFPEYLKDEFGIPYSRDFNQNIDLGICRGSKHKLYKIFLNNKIPYLLIEHDIESMRLGMNKELYEAEKEKIENANAIIFTSEDHAEYYENLAKKHNWRLPEYVIIHNKPLLKDINFIPKPKLTGLNIVYAGGIVERRYDRQGNTNYFNHKIYHYIAEAFIKEGWGFHIYPTKLASRNYYKEYRQIGCTIHDWVNGDKIYQEMSQYTVGLNAFNGIDTPESALYYAQHTRPNKIYDYLASGIPTIGYQGGEGMEIYKDKWGIVLNNLSEIKTIPDRITELSITEKMKRENTLDREREKFDYIIKKALNKKKILYIITKYETGSAYKHVQFMKNLYGGDIIKDNKSQEEKYIKEKSPEIIVVRGDGRTDYRSAIKYKIPYILIENDIATMRCSRVGDNEKEMLENASVVIFSSEDHIEYCKKYNLPYHVLIYNRPFRKDIEFTPKEKLTGLNLVYAGGMTRTKAAKMGKYGYRSYQDIFMKFIEGGWNVHLYPSINNSEYKGYQGIGCIVHKKLPYNELLKEMSQYTAGLHGYNKERVPEAAYNYALNCRGNKIWDYLAAGIPTIGYQGGRGMKIYDGKWGVIINDLEEKTLKELPERLDRIKITERMRKSNVMDRDKGKYEKIVEKALEEWGKKKSREPEPYKPFRNQNGEPFPKMIIVSNKGPREIARANRVFEGYKESEPFTVNKREWKEIKAHIGLLIKHMD